MKTDAEQVAVRTARRHCLMAKLSKGCEGAMALSRAGSVHMSISWSQHLSVNAACAFAGGGMTPQRSACQLSGDGA
eukprot:6207263-Pleurochrysis_carterae.AAC.4